jgi:class I lanthipeptide synthase
MKPANGTSLSAPAAPPVAWRPIADAALRARAEEALRRMATRFARPLPGWAPESAGPDARAAVEASLASGNAGQAVLHAYLARSGAPIPTSGSGLPKPGEAALARECLDAAIEAAGRVPMEAALFGGFVGIGWAVEHVGRNLRAGTADAALAEAAIAPDEGDDPLASIDEALLTALESGAALGDFDLVSGLTGIGVYALERLPRPAARECLRLVVDRLADRAESDRGGLAWRTPPDGMPSGVRKVGPYDLGAAHGVPGVIALLGQACAWDVAAARALLEGAVSWLLAQRLDPDGPGCFAATAGPGGGRQPARLAWCYGDAGIAATLLVAARAAGEAAWASEAIAIGRTAAERSDEGSGVRDAGLCHGAAGLAHIFLRLHHATGEALFADAGALWLSRALDLERAGGLDGFPSWFTPEDSASRWVADPGMLRGAAGVGLALLAATSPIDPAWDRALLISARGPEDAAA